jgi:hypothetical protein
VGLPDLPQGARLLTADEAVEKLVTGDHAGDSQGSVVLDAALIDALRAGLLVASQMPDGQIAFAVPGNDPAQ